LLLATAAIYWSTIFNHAVIALERQKKMLFGFFIVAVISVVGYLVFIPTYSYWAAAIITVISEVLILIISAAVVFSHTKHGLSLSVFGRSLAASILMGGLILTAESLSQNLIWLLLVGAVAYSLLIFALGGVKMELIREVLGRE